MNYISLFSGIEAASVAFGPLDWDPLAFAEVEPFCSALLAHHYPNVPNVGDVEAHDWSQYRGKCDLVIGGFPCQSFSVAGLRLSLDDARGNLSLAYVKTVRTIDPLWSIAENVPGWLSTRDNAFGCFLAAMVGEDAELKPTGGRWTDAGVVDGPLRTVAWRILDAQYFGVPQRRRRVFVVSVRGSGNWRCAAALFPVGQGLSGNPPPSRETGKDVARCVATGTNSQRYDWETENFVTGTLSPGMGGGAGHQYRRGSTDGLIADPLPGPHQRYDLDNVTHSLRADGFDASEDGTGRGTPLVTLQSGAQHAVAFSLGSHSGAADGDQTNRSHANGGPVGSGISEEVSHSLRSGRTQSVASSGVRRLTPIECEKLQGFEPNYTLIPYRGNPASDGPRYRALGNSFATPVVAWIGKRIAMVEGMS